MDPWSPQQSFIPQHLPEISAAAEFSEAPCGGRPVPRKTGGSLQNRLVVNLEFFRVHFWALWYLRSTAFSPGSLLRVLPRHFPPNRTIEVASCCVPGGNPQKSRAEHTAETPPRSVDTRRGRFDGIDQRRKARPFTSFNPCSKRSSNHGAGGPAVRPSHDATSTSRKNY